MTREARVLGRMGAYWDVHLLAIQANSWELHKVRGPVLGIVWSNMYES